MTRFFNSEYQKQPSRGVLKKRCSENMQQIYRRIPVLKCDFNKVAFQLYWNYTSAWMLSCKFAAYCQNIFTSEHLWTAASGIPMLKNRGSAEKIILTVNELCQRLLKSCVKQLCQQLLKIHVSDCWTIVPVTVEKPCRWLLNNMPATIEQSHQWLLKNRASECWTIVSPGKHKQIKRY